MAIYSAVTAGEKDPESPIDVNLIGKLDDNPRAMIEGASGAPRVQTAALVSGEQMTTSNVLGQVAGATAGGIGTYTFAKALTSNIALGSTIAGSSLTTTSALWRVEAPGSNDLALTGGGTLSGTWRCMGYYDYRDSTTLGSGSTLWLRIS